jgi:serine/threonine protein kinase
MKSSIPPPPFERSRIGRYEVIYPLGQGGMASVYVGRLVGMAGFERLVAIKVIHPHLSSNPLFVEMFLDEARLAGSIHHPNVGEIFEVGEDEGLFFMVGELVQGESLRSLLRRSKAAGIEMPLYVAAHIAAEVCKGLQAAHSLRNPEGEHLRLVHRDVSPRNVLLAYDGFVKLIDFGVAWAHGKSVNTEIGTIKGNVSYMSPEQICGQDLDRRSDLFSLGIVLYEMLTGTSPFPGKDKIERMHKILRGAFPRPRQVRPGLDPFLEKVLLRALEHHPDDRYSSAEAFGHDLGEFLHRSGKGPLAQVLSNYMHGLFADDIVIFDRKIRDYRRRTPVPGQIPAYVSPGGSSRPAAPLSDSTHPPKKEPISSYPSAALKASKSSVPGSQLSDAMSLVQPHRPSPGVEAALRKFVVDSETVSLSASTHTSSSSAAVEANVSSETSTQDSDSSISIKIPVMSDTDYGLDVCHSGYLQKLIQEELKRLGPREEGGGDAGAAPVSVQATQDEELITVTLPPLKYPTSQSLAPPAPDYGSFVQGTSDSRDLGRRLPLWIAIVAAALLGLTILLPSSERMDTEARVHADGDETVQRINPSALPVPEELASEGVDGEQESDDEQALYDEE